MNGDRDVHLEPGKLWSLWEIMEEVRGKNVVAAIDGLRDVQAIIQSNPGFLTVDSIKLWCETLGKELDNLGCRQTRKKVDNVLFLVEHSFPLAAQTATLETKAKTFSKNMDEVWSRLKDELEDQRLYCITAREAEGLRPVSDVYGAEVEAAFNGSIYDLEEASKCIAFSRSTAGVFHLMRAMETAVSLVGTTLQVTVVDKDNQDLEWGKIIANMKAPIEALPKGESKEAWSEALSLLYHVKQAWRNTTCTPNRPTH